MPLSQFSLPRADTRVIIHDGKVYKVKIDYKVGQNACYEPDELPCCHLTMQTEVEKLIRAIFSMLDQHSTLKIQTRHFWAEFSTIPWTTSDKLEFKKNGDVLQIFNQVIHVVLSPKTAVSLPATEPDSLVQLSESFEIDPTHTSPKRRHLPSRMLPSKSHIKALCSEYRDTSKIASRRLSYLSPEPVSAAGRTPSTKRKASDIPASTSKTDSSQKRRKPNTRMSPARNSGLMQQEDEEEANLSASTSKQKSSQKQRTPNTRMSPDRNSGLMRQEHEEETNLSASPSKLKSSQKRKKPNTRISPARNSGVLQQEHDGEANLSDVPHYRSTRSTKTVTRGTSHKDKNVRSRNTRARHDNADTASSVEAGGDTSCQPSKRPHHVQAHERDKTLIELEDKAEEMKLRQLTKPASPAIGRPNTRQSTSSDGILNKFLTPIKNLFTSTSK